MRLIMSRAVAAALTIGICRADSIMLPFDFSRTAIGLDVTVGSKSAYMILDTGVDPSVIDRKLAVAQGFKIDGGNGGQVSGVGNASDSQAYPSEITGLKIAGHAFTSVNALAFDMSNLSASYGRPLDGILGFSFLDGKIVLVDYPKTTLGILDRPGDAWESVKTCRKRFTLTMTFFPDDNTPAIPGFRFGDASGTISLDTGSSGGISLYQDALKLPGVTDELVAKGEVAFSGARGNGTAKSYVLNARVGFGPFSLPAGQVVSARETSGRAANVGNALFAAMKLKMLLDYRDRLMTFYGDCR